MRPRPAARAFSQLSRRRHLATPNRLALAGRRRRWVLQLWEAFLLQMDDFDRLIEFQLRRKLDPLVAAPVPVRRGRDGSRRPAKGRRDKHLAKTTGGAALQLEHS